MTVAWVIGAGGLLGSALCRTLHHQGTARFALPERLCWNTPKTLEAQLAEAVQAFSLKVAAAKRWEIYWAAGVGAMSSTADALEPETQALARLLCMLSKNSCLMQTPGTFALASSAGAVYAQSNDSIITEATTPGPTTAYGHEKLKQENLVREFAMAHGLASALVARVSTIYGPGQATGKTQGLLTHIARRMLRNQPIQIYVPFDTIRDYITADDAAAAVVQASNMAGNTHQVVMKIVAAEHPTTVAEIISTFKRITRRSPRVVTSASKLSVLYSRRVQFKSIVLTECRSSKAISLPVGIAQLMMAERLAYVGFPVGNR